MNRRGYLLRLGTISPTLAIPGCLTDDETHPRAGQDDLAPPGDNGAPRENGGSDDEDEEPTPEEQLVDAADEIVAEIEWLPEASTHVDQILGRRGEIIDHLSQLWENASAIDDSDLETVEELVKSHQAHMATFLGHYMVAPEWEEVEARRIEYYDDVRDYATINDRDRVGETLEKVFVEGMVTFNTSSIFDGSSMRETRETFSRTQIIPMPRINYLGESRRAYNNVYPLMRTGSPDPDKLNPDHCPGCGNPPPHPSIQLYLSGVYYEGEDFLDRSGAETGPYIEDAFANFPSIGGEYYYFRLGGNWAQTSPSHGRPRHPYSNAIIKFDSSNAAEAAYDELRAETVTDGSHDVTPYENEKLAWEGPVYAVGTRFGRYVAVLFAHPEERWGWEESDFTNTIFISTMFW